MFNRLKDCVVTNKNVVLRVDINVPVIDGVIQDDTRIKAIIPTIKYLIENKAKVVLISHFGRPKGKVVETMSLKQLVERISQLLGDVKVNFVDDCVGKKVVDAVKKTDYGQVVVLENLRFYNEEEKNDPKFASLLASNGNLYVNDAFSCCHRAHASIDKIAKILKPAAGFLLEKELDNLAILDDVAQENLLAIVGGSKVSTKIDLINNLMKKASAIFIAGGMANTFLYALGYEVGNSLCEKDLASKASEILENAKKHKCQIILPVDVVVTKKFEQNCPVHFKKIDDLEHDDIIGDVGVKSIEQLAKILENKTHIVWNGPLGAFEISPFGKSTFNLAKIIAKLSKNKKITSIAGGGDVVSALNQTGLINDFSYISTAGGAFLEYLEGKELPGIKAIKVG